METGRDERLAVPSHGNDFNSKAGAMLDMTLFAVIAVVSLLLIVWVLNSASAYVYCDIEVKVDVNKHVLYEGDKLVIKGNTEPGIQLEGLLIPLDGETSGKTVHIPLKRFYFEYTLHQFGSHDKVMKYATIVHGLKETNDGTCLVGDYEIVEYKGTRE